MKTDLQAFGKYLQAMHSNKSMASRLLWANTIDALLAAGVTFDDKQPPSTLVLLAAKEKVDLALHIHIPRAVEAYCRFLQTEFTLEDLQAEEKRTSIDNHPVAYMRNNVEKQLREIKAELLPTVSAAREFVLLTHPTLQELKDLDASAIEIVATGDNSCLKLHLTNPQRTAFLPKSELPNLHALCLETYALANALKAERMVPKVFPESIIKHLEPKFRSPIEAVYHPASWHSKWKSIDLMYMTMPIDADSSALRAWLLKVKADAAKTVT